jgi:hypothetical protein
MISILNSNMILYNSNIFLQYIPYLKLILFPTISSIRYVQSKSLLTNEQINFIKDICNYTLKHEQKTLYENSPYWNDCIRMYIDKNNIENNISKTNEEEDPLLFDDIEPC